jgi:hypothetical protein
LEGVEVISVCSVYLYEPETIYTGREKSRKADEAYDQPNSLRHVAKVLSSRGEGCMKRFETSLKVLVVVEAKWWC